MKRFAIVSVVLLLIALLGVGAMYMTSNVTVIAQGVTALEAYRNYDLFTDLSAQVRAGAVVGTSFVPAGAVQRGRLRLLHLHVPAGEQHNPARRDD